MDEPDLFKGETLTDQSDNFNFNN